MSWAFDKPEVPQFTPVFGRVEWCVACHEPDRDTDHATGLCRSCWRVVILGPAMANQDLP